MDSEQKGSKSIPRRSCLFVYLLPSVSTLSLTSSRAGDAAHAFPPTGGLGLNSGLGDVHNLAYKLAAVHQGWAGDAILNTYQTDRRQVALVNSNQSVKNGKEIFGLLKALGTTDENVDVARQNLYRNIQDPEAMVEINKGIEGQREHFDNLNLHIGYVYGDTEIPCHASVFNPVCVPGARLPHAWIRPIKSLKSSILLPPVDSSYVSELSPDQVKEKQYSTLDLCPFHAFTIVVDSAWAEQWKTCIAEARQFLPVPVRDTLNIDAAILGVDFELERDQSEWLKLMRIKDGQATLVRPDQHILATFESSSISSEDLVESLRGHLSW